MILRFKPGKKKCVICKNLFDRVQGQPFKNWCSTECAYEIIKRKNEKKKKSEEAKEKRDWVKKKKEMKEGLKTLPEYKNDLGDLVNTIARLIDLGHHCISCGGFGKPQAGHYHSVGSDDSLRYNLHNIHIQDYYCNVHRSANLQGYDEGVLKIYGKEYWNYMKFGIKNDYHEPIKLHVFEIKEKIVICRAIIKELEQNKTERSPEERIRLRNEYNHRIGIYLFNFQPF